MQMKIKHKMTKHQRKSNGVKVELKKNILEEQNGILFKTIIEVQSELENVKPFVFVIYF